MSAEWSPIVDTHAHVFKRDLPFISGSHVNHIRDFTFDDYILELDNAGVRYGVLSAASFLGAYNDYTLEAIKKHDRLRATVIVEPDVDFQYLESMKRNGVVGIRLAVGNMFRAPDLRSQPYRKLLEKVYNLDWHVHVFGRRDDLPNLLSALDESGVRVVIDHFGARDNLCGLGSESFSSILKIMKNGRTWIKLSAPYWSDKIEHKQIINKLLDDGYSHRLLWGSDWPFVKLNGELEYRNTIEWLKVWLPDELVRQSLDRNAIDLYGFK